MYKHFSKEMLSGKLDREEECRPSTRSGKVPLGLIPGTSGASPLRAKAVSSQTPSLAVGSPWLQTTRRTGGHKHQAPWPHTSEHNDSVEGGQLGAKVHRGVGGKELRDMVKGLQVSAWAPQCFSQTPHTGYKRQACWARGLGGLTTLSFFENYHRLHSHPSTLIPTARH